MKLTPLRRVFLVCLLGGLIITVSGCPALDATSGLPLQTPDDSPDPNDIDDPVAPGRKVNAGSAGSYTGDQLRATVGGQAAAVEVNDAGDIIVTVPDDLEPGEYELVVVDDETGDPVVEAPLEVIARSTTLDHWNILDLFELLGDPNE